MNTKLTEETTELLNAIGENIFVTDKDFTIVFINDYADDLLESLGSYIGNAKRKDLVGMNMDDFHPGVIAQRVRQTMENYTSWPYQTTISLFDKFTASIVVQPFEVNGERKGYVLTWKDVSGYEEELRKEDSRMQEMYTTILETSVDGCLLIPIVGYLDSRRFAAMKEKILEACQKEKATTVIFDFSGFTNIADHETLQELQKFKVSLSLLGLEQILTGISAKVANDLSNMSMTNLGLPIFPSFKYAINYVWEKHGFELKKK